MEILYSHLDQCHLCESKLGALRLYSWSGLGMVPSWVSRSSDTCWWRCLLLWIDLNLFSTRLVAWALWREMGSSWGGCGGCYPAVLCLSAKFLHVPFCHWQLCWCYHIPLLQLLCTSHLCGVPERFLWVSSQEREFRGYILSFNCSAPRSSSSAE